MISSASMDMLESRGLHALPARRLLADRLGHRRLLAGIRAPNLARLAELSARARTGVLLDLGRLLFRRSDRGWRGKQRFQNNHAGPRRARVAPAHAGAGTAGFHLAGAR